MIGTDKLKVNHISAIRGTTLLKNQYPKQAKSIAYAPQPAPNCRRSVKGRSPSGYNEGTSGRGYQRHSSRNPAALFGGGQDSDLLEGLHGEASIAELCRREGTVQNLYYRWSKEFIEAKKKRLPGDTCKLICETRHWPR